MAVVAAVGLATSAAAPGASARQDSFGSAGQAAAAARVGQASYLGTARTLVLARGETSLLAMRQQARADRQAARRAERLAARRAVERSADARQAAAQQATTPPPATAPAPPAQPSGSPRQIAASMLGSYGWSGQFGCLQALWNRESGWNPTASNPDGAYGIPQALPGLKMASAGADWQTDAATQIRWGLGYIKSTYGSPCAAWSHEEATGWY